ncbi:MAG: JAB domain-containing protein [Bacteroidota bacterium]
MRDKVNEITVSYCEKLGVIDSLPLKDSGQVARLLYENWDSNTIGLKETFKVLLLNNANKVKGTYQASIGGITGTIVDVRLLFAVVLKTASVNIILAHNHPAGTLKPSEADKQLTEKIQNAAELFDIRVLDHLIIAPHGKYFSFSDSGLL